uniref:Uncharacterized protein n=1 Tax=Siphoviridae sp. ctqPo10 TaxID=2827948 RepID=A0A8S5SW18_9CAUD|nr:MAG TPA: hypothetical protein [Siphoviridae sp. ctqPo10]DAI19724.1 MAG TPA: hypothetical protein [Caudoviricetes sp.]DAK25467.1 MAG TPA: hypothetical protein [Caudoviricetes sp.]DAN25110.1 MAG TPA: hypothetical protein [Caudoviricetes sp.]DAR46402.1 MAG TPA: hypothetical protein [Caudoviricetes sp.]
MNYGIVISLISLVVNMVNVGLNIYDHVSR